MIDKEDIKLILEDLRKLDFVASELAGYFEKDVTKARERMDVLFSYPHMAIKKQILTDYINNIKTKLNNLIKSEAE